MSDRSGMMAGLLALAAVLGVGLLALAVLGAWLL